MDVVVYGGANTQLHGPDGQLATVWSGAMPGGSLQRVSENTWSRNANPNPGNCMVYGAY